MTRQSAFAILMVAWSCSSASAQSLDPAPIFEHRLTIDLVQRTVAVDRDLLALMKKDPDFARRAPEKSVGIDAIARSIEAVPEFAGAFAAHGITARDYVLTQRALLSTTTILELQAKGGTPPLPPGTPTHNLEFWKASAFAGRAR